MFEHLATSHKKDTDNDVNNNSNDSNIDNNDDNSKSNSYCNDRINCIFALWLSTTKSVLLFFSTHFVIHVINSIYS